MAEEATLQVLQPVVDEQAPELVSEQVSDSVTSAEATSPNYEELARAEGWKTKNQLGDAYDPARYVSAEEFVKRKPLFETIKQQSKAIKELKKTVESVVAFSKQNAEAAAQQAIDNLMAQKRDAIINGDVEAVEKIDKSIKGHERIAESATAPTVPSEVSDWVAENPWFDKDLELQDFATAYCANYAKRNPNAPIEEALRATEGATKRAFPDSKYFAPGS